MEPTYYVTRKPVQRYSDEPVSYQTIVATKTPPDDKNYAPDLEFVVCTVLHPYQHLAHAIAEACNKEAVKARLEYLREQIRGECISYDGIAELQSLVADIEPGDVELLEWAGVPENDEPDTNDATCSQCGESYQPDYQMARADLCPVCRREAAAHAEFGAYS